MTKARPGSGRAVARAVRPAAGPAAGGARWRGLLVVAIDGTIMAVADSAANLARYSKQRGGENGASGYPMVRVLALVSCGTRTVSTRCSPPISSGETTYAPGLFGSLRAGMILLADRNFGAVIAGDRGTGADFLIRSGPGAAPRGSGHGACPTGPSCRGSAGSRSGSSKPGSPSPPATGTPPPATGWSPRCRPGRYPAGEWPLYHERWEVESDYFELKSSMLGGRVLRARTPSGVEQEVWALLVTYQALRTAMADATGASRASTPTGPASVSPWAPPATRSSQPPASARPRRRPGRHDRPAVLASLCPDAGSGSAPASSNEQSPNIAPKATSTAPTTPQPSPSPSLASH